jgi:glycosyltransferase involved in cell wall biosynthesis
MDYSFMNNKKKIESYNLNEISITLCICTMNRPDDLNRCLESVFQSIEKPDEVIVSDDSPDPQLTKAIVTKYSGVIYQQGPRRGLGSNRNACIRLTSKSHIIFIDDDTCVPPEFFAVARKLTSSSEAKTIITGHEINYGGGGRWEGEVRKVVPQNADFWGIMKVPVNNKYRNIVMNSTIFPKNLFEQALFDERLRYGYEELDLARHTVSLGYQITYQDCLYVNHYPSPINREYYKQFTEASRLYAVTKAYWKYESSPLKSLAFVVLAPLQLAGSLFKRGDLMGLCKAAQASIIACRYFFVEPKIFTSESNLN